MCCDALNARFELTILCWMFEREGARKIVEEISRSYVSTELKGGHVILFFTSGPCGHEKFFIMPGLSKW